MSVVITETAAREINSIMSQQNLDRETTRLRVGVKGGGCSGFQYNLSFDLWDDNDMVFWTNEDNEKFPIIVDKRSFLYVAGSEVNYHDGLMGSGFTVDNPNANSTCGCGESFSV